ncbi:hypothetical protein DNTS_004239 [Danionella cerebrum]|uniref:Pre-mRNA-processing factor 17 n=1 Tax=Danionella cerebrum TaxID=2873325 RepID=A0A553Q9Z5_9TELE|nr:hypothetical protein DNTS_004239 [Danionella translucida]TRY86754.1 hypothetical protein DNTS_004239 [Danionella translucida]
MPGKFQLQGPADVTLTTVKMAAPAISLVSYGSDSDSENEAETRNNSEKDDPDSMVHLQPLKSGGITTLAVLNSAPEVAVKEDVETGIHLDPALKEVTYNPMYETMFAPEFGPTNPFRSEQMAAPRNMLSGYAEPAHVNDFMFEQQRRTFSTFGYALDPSVDTSQVSSSSYIGAIEEAEKNKGLTVFESGTKKCEKRKKVKGGEAGDIDNFLGPWAKYQDESESAKPSEEEKKELEEYLAKRHKRGKKEEEAPAEEKTILHIKDAYDYQGRSYLHIPQDVGVNLRSTELWEVYNERRCVRTFIGHSKAVRDICFNNSGTQFLSAGYDRYIKLWDSETGKCIAPFTNRKVPYCVKFNPDEDKQNLFVAGMSDKKIIQFDVRTGEVVQEYDRHLGAVNTITFVDENRRFVSTSDDKSLRVWEWDIPVDFKYIAEPSMHSMPAVTLSPNGKWLACQSMDNQILIFGAQNRFRLNKKKIFKGHMVAGYACQVGFSPDMSYVVSGDADGKLNIWDWKTTKLYHRIKAHDKVCISAIWHPHETSKHLLTPLAELYILSSALRNTRLMVTSRNMRLLLMMIVFVSCQAQDTGGPCWMSDRFKPFKRYEYFYESQSFNALNGQTNGPKSSCKVELSSPGSCRFVLHTSDCKLNEVMTRTSGEDQEMSGEASRTQEEFSRAMEKHPLKFIMEGEDVIRLFPAKDELTNILNFKRGIISALAVPLIQEDRKRKTPSIYGLCETETKVTPGEHSVSLHRDLNNCDEFRAVQDHTSPLALFTGMHHTLAQLIQSNQTCRYEFDKEHGHLSYGVCTERHLLLPFSNMGHGVKNSGKQILTLKAVSDEDSKDFEHDQSMMKPLRMDYIVDKNPIQNPEEALKLLEELHGHSKSSSEHKRSLLAFKLISTLRRMERETLLNLLPRALSLSHSLTYQFLLQCGTPECTGALVKSVGLLEDSDGEKEAMVYAVGIISASSPELVKEVLEVVKAKPNKAVFYALSYTIRRLYEAEGVSPEVQATAQFFHQEIGDCSGDQEHLYLSLRAMGNMATALFSALPDLHSRVSECINHPGASSAAQHAAVQIYRRSPIPEESRPVLMQALLERSGSIQKRVAAYLTLMRNPKPAELTRLSELLEMEENPQIRSFIISHISSILGSSTAETQDLRQEVLNAFQKNEIGRLALSSQHLSRHYSLGSLEGNFLFESERSLLPKEIMLEMSLDALGLEMDLIEIGMEGEGFEPVVEALFGEDGFFPDTVMKSILFAMDRMPEELNEIMDNMLPVINNLRKKRQVSENVLEDISHNLSKLLQELKSQKSPEAMVYLKLFGAELGYLDLKDVKMLGSLLQMIPRDFPKRLFSSLDHELFLHYVFMDNEFHLPTGTGFPLRVAVSGTVAPGVKGGLKLSPGKGDFSFLLSAGVALVAEFGAHFPDYVHCGLGMYTNVHLESGVTGKVTWSSNKLKLSILPPEKPHEIFSITNVRTSFAGEKMELVPSSGPDVDGKPCTPTFAGLRLCQTVAYPESVTNAPYFPLSGDSSYKLMLHPSGTVSEYSADISYSNKDEEHKLTFALKAEGSDLEALSTVVLNTKQGTIDLSTTIKAFLLHYEASVKVRRQKLSLEVESDLKLPGTTSVQRLLLKHDFSLDSGKERFEAEFKSEFNSEVRRINPFIGPVEYLINSFFDQRMGPNEVQVREILDKLTRFWGVPAMMAINVPQNLYLNVEAAAKYDFGQLDYDIEIPLPFGGKSTKDLNFPTHISTPKLMVPELGLEFDSKTMHLPEVFIPAEVIVAVPIFDSLEVSGKLSSNIYDVETSLSAVREPGADASYSAKVEFSGTSPAELFSLNLEGSARVEGKPGGVLKADVKTVIKHKIFDVTLSVEQEVESAGKLKVQSKSNLLVTSSYVNMQMSLEDTRKIEMDSEQISEQGNLEGSFKAGMIHGSSSFRQSVLLIPSRSEAKIDSFLKVDSKPLQAQNSIAVTFSDGALLILSNTAAFDERLTNNARIAFRESQFELKSETKALASGATFQNTAEVRSTTEDVKVKFETTTTISQERIYSIVTGALNAGGLSIENDASVKLMGHTASHKTNLNIDKNGLTSRGSTSVQSLLNRKEVKNSFEILYQSFSGTVHSQTNGEIMGSTINHRSEIDIDRMVTKIKNHFSIRNRIFQMNHHSSASTFPFSIHFTTNTKGEETIHIWRKYWGQFEGNVHLKADSESFAHSHRFKISTRAELDYFTELRFMFESISNSSIEAFEQTSSWNIGAALDDFILKQELKTYNNPAQLGFEATAGVYTRQEFVVSGFLKYDKSGELYLVDVPFVESLRLTLLNLRDLCISIDEALIDYLSREGVSNKIQSLAQVFRNFVSKVNMERRAEQVKHAWIDALGAYEGKMGVLEKLVKAVNNQFREGLHHFKQLALKGMTKNDIRLFNPYIFEDVTLLFNSIKTQISTMINDFLSTEQTLPMSTFGKLFGEIKLQSPYVTIETVAEFKNSSLNHPVFTAVLKSEASSFLFVHLNYKLESTAQISVPKSTPVEVSETLQITYGGFKLDQQGSLKLNASVSSHDNGSSFSLETLYSNQLKIPSLPLSTEFSMVQKAVATCENRAGLTLIIKNEGNGKIALEDFSDVGTHISEMCLNIGLSSAELTLTGSTDSSALDVKMNVSSDAVALSHLKFNIFTETKSPVLKRSFVVAFGKISFNNIEVDINGTHVTEFVGVVNGLISNQVFIKNSPGAPATAHFLNSARGTNDIFEVLADVYLQSDYTAFFDWEKQEISTKTTVKMNHFTYSHNLTAFNNKTELGIYALGTSKGSLGLLSATELLVPTIITENIKDHGVIDVDVLWDAFRMDDKQTDLTSRLIYEKNWFDSSSVLSLFSVPLLGNLVSGGSYTSSVFNLTADAGIYPKDYQMHFCAASTSVFENLNSKIEGATALMVKPGLNLDSYLSIEKPHLKATHNSSLTLGENYEMVMDVDTIAKIHLEGVTIKAAHEISADNKVLPQATSNLKINYTFDHQESKAAGYGDAENSIKLNASLSSIFIESVSQITTNTSFSDRSAKKLVGVVDNEAKLSLTIDGLKSYMKTTGDGQYMVLWFDIDEQWTVSAALDRILVSLEIDSNYTFNHDEIRAIKHKASGQADLRPLSTALAAVDMFLTQPDKSEFNTTDEWFHFSSTKNVINLQVLSRWFNSSTNLTGEAFPDSPDKWFLLGCSLNFTAPSMVVVYEGELDIGPPK